MNNVGRADTLRLCHRACCDRGIGRQRLRGFALGDASRERGRRVLIGRSQPIVGCSSAEEDERDRKERAVHCGDDL